jgi:hypothetical protein
MYIPEISGPGCGLFDYDNDGDLARNEAGKTCSADTEDDS